MVFGEVNVTGSYDYLIDSDIFVALFILKDAHAPTVNQLLTDIEKSRQKVCTTNWVVAETATVLSTKDSQQTAISFLTMIDEGDIPILPITPEIEQETHHIFCEQTTKHISMVDCSNVATVNHYNIANLLSFDKFYAKFGYSIKHI
jgi:predicted nucleic acid-binding protein